MYLVCYPVIFDFFSLPSFLIYSLIYTNNTFITFIKITQNKKNYIYFVRLSQRSNCTLVFYLYLLCMFWFHTTPSTLFKSRFNLLFWTSSFSCSGPSRANRRVLDAAAFKNILTAWSVRKKDFFKSADFSDFCLRIHDFWQQKWINLEAPSN